MKEEIIKHIGFNELCDIIERAKTLLILCFLIYYFNRIYTH